MFYCLQLKGAIDLRKFALFLACVVMFTGLYSVSSGAESNDMVIMLYMTGSSLESDGGAASRDLEEMIRSIQGKNSIRIVAMIAGADKWALDIPADETSIYEVTGNGLNRVQRGESRSMGDPETLADFLAYAESGYPADQYGLIIWDHGAGPLGGVCFDETRKTDGIADKLTLEELGRALSDSPFSTRKLSFLGFDACLMASLEVASAISPYAEYMIASQDTEPVEGWDYAFLQELTGKESGDQIGRQVIAFYEESRRDNPRPVTLSCLDLRFMDEVRSALGSFFADLEPGISEEMFHKYTKCRSDSKTMGNTTTSRYDLIDLLDLLSLYQESRLADCSELVRILQSMITCHFAANDDFANGISIYYPFDNKTKYETTWSSDYSRLDFVPQYQTFIKKMADITMGEALFNWKSSYQVRLQQEAGTVKLSVDLTPEEMENLARARLIVVEELQKDNYQQLYVDYDNLRRFDDSISAVYHGEALYQVDENGEIIAGPVTYYPVDNGIAVYGLLEYPFDFDQLFSADFSFDPDASFNTQKGPDPAQLVYCLQEDGSLAFSDVMILQDNGLHLPSAVNLSECEGFTLVNSGPSAITSLEHTLQDYVPLDISKGAPILKFLPVYGSNTRHAYIRLTDLQGQNAFSEVVEIPNPALISIASEQVCLENELFRLTLISADLVSGYNAGIKCVFSLKNVSQETFRTSVTKAALNAVPVDGYSWRTVAFEPDEEDEIVIFIDGASIKRTGIQEAASLNFSLSLSGADKQFGEYQISIPVQLNTAVFSAVSE